ncbi:HD domain-containing protein [Aldersonia sp. NBC_00410]|uniref:HD domain-containing protein n=1 Tax=Aldersonia sp. NBC_00410 TaxID=2975954 RepID=UPI0022568FA3|nr:HD domain-containing protein [Aldersonia sp. NBC_00410]MCX5041737.1 HD domain-containing protein [Aldersonia sp. NBC_00410]
MQEAPLDSRPLALAAQDLARRLTTDEPRLFDHLRGVAARAESFAPTVPADDRDALIAAAWLHDIGKVPALHDTGLHGVDGARFLRRSGWPARVYNLVAYHSGSRFIAPLRGLATELREFTDTDDEATDALTLADQTTSQDGAELDLDERIADMLARHAPDSPTVLAHPLREGYLRAVANRVSGRIAGLKATGS